MNSKEVFDARNEIMKDFISQRIDITKPLLLSCIANHEKLCTRGKMSNRNKKLLNEAIIVIWNETFETNITSRDIMANVS